MLLIIGVILLFGVFFIGYAVWAAIKLLIQ